MYRSPPLEPSRTIIHRPSPRMLVYLCMVFLAMTVLPGVFVNPAKMFASGGFGMLVFFLFELLLLGIAIRRVTLTVDAQQTRLVVRGTRWPLAPRVRELAVADIRGVVRQKAPCGRGNRLVLELRSGDAYPITTSYYGDTGQFDRDMKAIRDLVGLSASSGEAAPS